MVAGGSGAITFFTTTTAGDAPPLTLLLLRVKPPLREARALVVEAAVGLAAFLPPRLKDALLAARHERLAAGAAIVVTCYELNTETEQRGREGMYDETRKKKR